jgi:hypothetical protein
LRGQFDPRGSFVKPLTLCVWIRNLDGDPPLRAWIREKAAKALCQIKAELELACQCFFAREFAALSIKRL